MSPAKTLPASGLEYWLQSCRAHGLSKDYGICGLKDLSRTTLVMYQKCWRKFSDWYNKWQVDYDGITVNKICYFLLFLFNSKNNSGNDYSGEALNTFRSAISYFVKLDFPNLGHHEKVVKLFGSFRKQRPSFPRYQVTWDVGIVLRFLASWHPPSELSLKKLTLKTAVLIAITSSDEHKPYML